jgi:DNA-binding NtrC family response regulator
MGERARKNKPRLETWLKSAKTPVYLVSGSRRFLYFNSGCQHLSGWTADEVVGQIAEYHSETEPHSLTAILTALCPPPEVLEGQELDVPVFIPNRSGSQSARLIHFVPIRADDDRVTSILGIIVPLPQPRPPQPESLALRYHAELSAVRWALRQRYGISTVVARSPAMQRVLQQLQLARTGTIAVHFFGQRGVGKEHLARALHLSAESSSGSFVPLDCRLPPISLQPTLQRLLHPSREDAPVGALQPRTVLLQNVEHLPRDLQERLLNEYRADDATSGRLIPLPRLLSSSTQTLKTAVDDGRMLPEFFFLLTPLTIEVPPLRERREDLPLLAQAFLESLNRGAERQVSGFADTIWPLFAEYGWPGNLDELRLVIQEARERGTRSVISDADLPLRFRAGWEAQCVGPPQRSDDELPIPQLESYLAQIEREVIERALAKAKGNKTLAARLLGIPRPVLYRRLGTLKLLDKD